MRYKCVTDDSVLGLFFVWVQKIMRHQKQISKSAVLGLSLLLGTTSAFGQDGSADIYSFGGSCPSQGAWTQAALKETRRISGIIENLKNNPDCTGIVNVVQQLKTAEEALGAQDVKGVGDKAESLPSEIDAIRRMMVSGNTGATLRDLLFKKTLTAAAQGSREVDLSAAAAVNPTAAISAIYQRTKRATNYGLNAIEQVFNVLPSYDKCLLGHPDEGMLLVSAAVKVGAAFASSGGGVAHSLGSALGGLVKMMRDRKFTLALQSAKQKEFWMSISCILETTAKNTCDIDNYLDQLDWSRQEYKKSMLKVSTGSADPQNDNPLEGYYILIRDLPLISQWLNKVKFGVEPKNESDAENQVSAMEDVIEFQKIMKRAPSQFNQAMREMMAYPSEDARRLAVLDALIKIESTLTKSRGARFVLQAKNDDVLPYYLVGLPGIPDEMTGTTVNIDWVKWMRMKGPNNGLQGFFDDPIALSKTIEMRLKDLLVAAEGNAQAFFRNRLLIDPSNLVVMTLNGQNNSVKEALFHTIRYLIRLEKRLDRDTDTDMTLLPTVVETRERLMKIVAAYDGISAFGRGYQAGDVKTFSKNKDYEAVILKLIDTAYDELEVLYLSDAFLSGRLYSMIDYDFSMRVRRGSGLDKHQADLLAITQEHMVERLVQLHGLNPNDSIDDLANAKDINRGNLYTLEEIFSTPIFLMLEELNEIVHGRSASSEALKKVTRARYEADRAKEMATYYPDMWSQFIGWLNSGRTVKKKDPDLYHRTTNPNKVWGTDDQHGTAAQVRARVCIQTLAFQNRGKFYDLCKDAVLKSYFAVDELNPQLNARYADYWPTSWQKSTGAVNAEAWNKSNVILHKDKKRTANRVCALNNRNLRNFVHHLQDRDRRTSATSFRETLDSIPKPDPKPEPEKAPQSSIPTDELGPLGGMSSNTTLPSQEGETLPSSNMSLPLPSTNSTDAGNPPVRLPPQE